jgi:hypothetical protein
MHLKDLAPLVDIALKCSFFQAMSSTFIQVRGVCIGNPAAPAICSATVSIDEYMWKTSFKVCINNTLLSRYVDNRLVCLPLNMMCLPEWKNLLNLEFYKHPVELESCNSDVYLGFTLNVPERTLLYIIPPHAGQYRSFQSAGSLHLKLSGLRSRLHLLFAGTYPKSAAPPIAKILVSQYVAKGFPKAETSAIYARVRTKFFQKRALRQ